MRCVLRWQNQWILYMYCLLPLRIVWPTVPDEWYRDIDTCVQVEGAKAHNWFEFLFVCNAKCKNNCNLCKVVFFISLIRQHSNSIIYPTIILSNIRYCPNAYAIKLKYSHSWLREHLCVSIDVLLHRQCPLLVLSLLLRSANVIISLGSPFRINF